MASHPPTQPQHPRPAPLDEFPANCPLCARALKPRWLRKSLPAKSIHGIVVCPKCRNAFATRRQAAYIVDSILIGLVAYAAAEALYLLLPLQPVTPVTVAIPWIAMQLILSYVLIPLMFTLKDGFSGKSPGRALFGVTVVDRVTREPISFGQSFKRNLILMVPYIGFIWVALTMMKGRRVGDNWANTEVIWDRFRHKPPFDPRGILCMACGYDLTGNVSGVCPECGTPIVHSRSEPA